MAQAQLAAPTLPVHGKGAPAAPTSVTASPAPEIDKVSAANASGYSDPDGDPFGQWQYEWRSAANGAGVLLGSAETYTPVRITPLYLRARALAGRGYPATQLTGAWREVVLMPLSCTQGTVTSGGLTYTCPLTQTVANANGVAYSSTYTENGSYGLAGQTYIRQTWSQANTYCNNLGNGYRLPSHAELSALYNAKGEMFLAANWPGSQFYWSSTFTSAGRHYGAGLRVGNIDDNTDVTPGYVSCVR